jgi:hypothetical protein
MKTTWIEYLCTLIECPYSLKSFTHTPNPLTLRGADPHVRVCVSLRVRAHVLINMHARVGVRGYTSVRVRACVVCLFIGI